MAAVASHQNTAAVPAFVRNPAQLLQTEEELLRDLRLNAVAVSALLENFRKESARLLGERDEIATKLLAARTQLAAQRRTRDVLTFPPSMKIWNRRLRDLAASSTQEDGAAASKKEAASRANVVSFREPAGAVSNTGKGVLGVVYSAPPTKLERQELAERLAAWDKVGSTVTGALRQAANSGPVVLAQQPNSELVASATIPVMSSAGEVTSRRSLLTDFSVVDTSTCGRAVAAVRPYTSGSLLFEETAVLAVPFAANIGILVADALPEPWRMSLDKLLSQDKVFGKRPRWPKLLIPALFAYLQAQLVPEVDPTSSAMPSLSRVRATLKEIILTHLACPLDAMDVNILNDTCDFARFVHAGLPNGTREDDHLVVEPAEDAVLNATDDAVLPRSCRLSEDDVTRFIVAFQCNALSTHSVAATAASATAFIRGAVGATRGAYRSLGVSASGRVTGHTRSEEADARRTVPTHLSALFPGIALLEHSALPNATVVFTQPEPGSANTRARVVALREIAAGERLSIQYTNAFLPLQERRQKLQLSHHFTDMTDASEVDLVRAIWVGGTLVAPIGEGLQWRVVEHDTAAAGKTKVTLARASSDLVLSALRTESACVEALPRFSAAWSKAVESNDGELDAAQFVAQPGDVDVNEEVEDAGATQQQEILSLIRTEATALRELVARDAKRRRHFGNHTLSTLTSSSTKGDHEDPEATLPVVPDAAASEVNLAASVHPVHYGAGARATHLLQRCYALVQLGSPLKAIASRAIGEACTAAMLVIATAAAALAPSFPSRWFSDDLLAKKGFSVTKLNSKQDMTTGTERVPLSVRGGHEAKMVFIASQLELAASVMEYLSRDACAEVLTAVRTAVLLQPTNKGSTMTAASPSWASDEEDEEDDDTNAESTAGYGSGAKIASRHVWYAIVLLYKGVLGWHAHPRCIAAQLHAEFPGQALYPLGPTNTV